MGGVPVQAGAECFNLYIHGLLRVAMGIPEVRVADLAFNAASTVDLMAQAADHKAVLALCPELGLSAYACDDLFQQQALLDGSLKALRTVLHTSERLSLITVVGLPLPAAARHPPRHRPFVEAKRRDSRLRRIAMGEQCHHQGDSLSRRAQSVKRGAFVGAERLAALGAEISPVLAQVDTNILLNYLFYRLTD